MIHKTASNNEEFYREYQINQLHRMEALEALKVIALNRSEWQKFSKKIYKTAE